MTCARMKEFNKKFNTSFQIYNPKNRHFHPRDVHDELDWVFYLHNMHICLIRRSQQSLGIQEIGDNYEQVWKTCRDDNAVTQVSPLKLNVLSSMSDDALIAWDCETYSEKDTRRAIPYACTLINLEKLRKKLETIKDIFLNPTDNVPEEFYDKLMNVELFVGNDNDAVNKKYLLDQINAIQIDKDHVENRINDVKRFIRRNIKNLVDEPKLQQELTSLKRLIQVDKTSELISKLDDKITKDRLKRKLTALERKLGELLAELDNTADKTELQNSISNLNEKIAKQKSDVQDIINTLPIDKDTLKQQLTALDTKITDEKEVGVIKNFLQNKFRDYMKNYIKEQVNLLVTRIHDDFLRQERKLSKLEAIVTDKSYYFNLPFESDTVYDRKDQIYKSNKYGFKAEIKVGSLAYGEPKNVFDIGETQEFSFRGNCLIQIEFPMKVKVNKVVFKQTGKAVKHISLFNDGNLEENIRLIDKRDQEIETKNGKYVDTFKMEVKNDKDIIGIKDLDMILETENPPSTNIDKIPPRLHKHGKIESSSHEFLKLYFALGEKYTSIDVHKSQQEREFIVHLTFAEGSDSILHAGGYIFRAKINIEKEKIKYSYHLKDDHTKKEMSLVRVNVFYY
ncbi:hypothetical protein LOTGIDRAFT_176091 [Lottia gigantea]|uniref:Uncharacterized protein n=1 Tax=Lottia gigantea TaxID=225164 RepID=V3Z2T4_LOTGI|nr:hypothetical protein LOTGIDRAFT_176091 [Lottia gigantea]ESO84903.1 hypothetical protein LOTGIDRAFT_176091 [Lottia gigantea]